MLKASVMSIKNYDMNERLPMLKASVMSIKNYDMNEQLC